MQVSTRGLSMLPILRPGAILTIINHPFASVRCGQVVAFACGQRLIVHRVIDRTAGYLVTLGDNMPLLDPPVTPEAYVGLVADTSHALSSAQAGDGISALSKKQGDSQIPIRPASTVTVVLPEGIDAVAPRGIKLAALPSAQGFQSPDSLCVGISPAGALTARALPELLDLGAKCHLNVLILLGFMFGPADPARAGPVLPPEVAAFHVRLGLPWERIEISVALDELVKHVDLSRRPRSAK